MRAYATLSGDFELLVAEVGDLLMNGREQTVDVVSLCA
jgi:hypothetical protein